MERANCPRIITRTYQAADCCGNTTTCTQMITVNDTLPRRSLARRL